ncbi:hypothetical protein OBV_10070 [Oscillibacter valericigenes Sjm18-20]|nr:hypothetical protein OBV_10070 [Oscillibacter valericigenes Sjm18-20]
MKICEEYASLLDPFIDGELTGDEATRVREHLASCPACAAYVADALAIRAAFGDIDETQVPEGLSDGVMAVIRAHAVPQKKKAQWIKVAASLAACAVIVFAAVRVMPFGGSSGTGAPLLSAPSAACSNDSDNSASMEMQTRDAEDRLEAQDSGQLSSGSQTEGALYDAGAGSNEKSTSSEQIPESYSLLAPANTQADAGTAGGSTESDAEGRAFHDRVLDTAADDASYDERLADLDGYVEETVYSGMNFGFETESHTQNGSAIAWYGQVSGMPPDANRYSLYLYLSDRTVTPLPLPWADAINCALPDKMWFDGDTFVYEVVFTEDAPNLVSGEGFSHVKGTYRYTVDLTARTVSLEIQQ